MIRADSIASDKATMLLDECLLLPSNILMLFKKQSHYHEVTPLHEDREETTSKNE